MKHSTMKHFVEASSKFAVDLFKQLLKDRSGSNYVSFSIGAQMSLALLLLGSGKETADEIRKALHFLHWTETGTITDDPNSGSECDKPGGFHSHFKQLLSVINQSSRHHMLKIGSRLYGSDTSVFLERYVQCMKELYNSELESVDFMNANEEVRKKINSWVERQTNGEIINFFPVNSIDRSTIMILLNTVVFQGKWKIPFNPKDTHRGVFWTCKDQSMYVDMMTQRGRFNIANISSPPMTVLEIPNENDELIVVFLVPDSKISTEELITNLTYEHLQEWTNSENMKSVVTKIFMPKFTVQNHYPLKSVFSNLGVKDLFIPGRADLSGMTGNDQLLVSQINQGISFTISEEGADAAGASRTEVVSGSHPEVRINSPFLFMVKHKASDMILFLGRTCLPKWKVHPK